ncbi:SDR family NAD(P)-dependent oxidoreductase [Burkholderia sp. LMG 21824]|uniref:SDR family NAD(P)-dependent oxidoreductase n=1 Tax=Burkholderia sp. LMG 21824 TaxID=3158172 RepID=UPI003C2CF6CC
MDGRVALVTGSASGIGAAIARRLAGEGFSVVLHSKESVDAGMSLASELGSAIYVQADLSNDEDRVRLIRQAIEAWGRLNVLINNAGISRTISHSNLLAAAPAYWRELNEINVIAPFRLISEAQSALRDSSKPGCPSCIVNITSHAGLRPKGASIPYAASKAALNHVTRMLAVTLAPHIRVNAVAPGLVDSPLTSTWTDMRDLWRDRSPMGRSATPDDIAQGVAMLVESHYVTGETLLLDGGMNLT